MTTANLRRAHPQNVGATPVQLGDVIGKGPEPGVVELAALAVDEQRRADLENDAAELVQRGDHGKAGANSLEVVAFVQCNALRAPLQSLGLLLGRREPRGIDLGKERPESLLDALARCRR